MLGEKPIKVIELGSRVKDTISGFTGIAVAITKWLNGCIRYGIASETLTEDGTVAENQWFDLEQIEVVDAKEAETKTERRPPGGPRSDPKGCRD